MKPTIFITGATGKVGGAALKAIAAGGSAQLIAGVRNETKAAALRDLGFETRHFDLDEPESLAPALRGVERALLITGYSVDMLLQSIRFLDAAKAAGVQHIVHLGTSGAATSEVAHWGWHRLVEAYIEKLGFSFTHLRPEAFMQNVTEPGYGWLQGSVLTNYIADAKWTWVDAEEVGIAAAKALSNTEAHAGLTYRLGSDGKTMHQVAEILGRAIGQPVRIKNSLPDEFLATSIAAGADSAYMNCVCRQFKLDAAGKIPGAGEVFPGLEQFLGHPGQTWETFAASWAKKSLISEST